MNSRTTIPQSIALTNTPRRCPLLANCVQIPRAIGAFYHVLKWHNAQRARSEMRRCTTHASTDPSYDNRTIASTLKMQIWIATNNRDVPRVMKTKFPVTVMVFGVVSSEGHIMPPHIFEVGLKVNTKVYLDVLKSVVIPWCNQVAAGLGAGPQVQRDPGLTSEGVLRLCTLLTGPLLPWHEPAGLLRLVIRREHHLHDLLQHQSQPDRRLPQSIRRSAGVCGKGMLPVPDPYRGGDWGWKWLHWIDVSSTT